MSEQINEYKDYPKWVDALSKEDQYQWYLRAKKSLPLFKTLNDTTELEQAIFEYEVRNNIK